MPSMRTVGELSRLAGVTVRTLHHYDEIGLLSPSGRTEAGYRLYAYEDLARLQEILVWRQLGFSLQEIQQLLDDPGHDRADALRRQRELVALELERLGATARALDAALAAHENGTKMKETRCSRTSIPTEYEDEARERWGHTDAYRESARRAAGYGEPEWAEIRAEADQVVTRLHRADAARASRPPGSGPAPWPSATASTSRAGSIRSPPRCTATWRDVHRRPAVHRQLREGGRGTGRLRPRRRDRQRRRPGGGATVIAARSRGGQSVIAMCPGWAATRVSHSRTAG